MKSYQSVSHPLAEVEAQLWVRSNSQTFAQTIYSRRNIHQIYIYQSQNLVISTSSRSKTQNL